MLNNGESPLKRRKAESSYQEEVMESNMKRMPVLEGSLASRKRLHSEIDDQVGVLATSALVPSSDGLLQSPKRVAPSTISYKSPSVIRTMNKIGEKEAGLSRGFIGKSPVNNRSYIVKKGFKRTSRPPVVDPRPYSFTKDGSDVIYEFIFDPVFQKLLGSDKAPAIRLHVDQDNILCVASRMLEEFVLLKESAYFPPKKPENLELLFAVSAFLGDDDCHDENISVDGRKIDHGRASALQMPNAELFVSTLEFLFKFRFGKYGFDLDYQKLSDAFALIQHTSKDEIIELMKQQMRILKEQLLDKDLREIRFLKIEVNQEIEDIHQYRGCIGRNMEINSWETLESQLTGFINKQFAMLPEVMGILNRKVVVEQAAALVRQQEYDAMPATVIASDSEEEYVATLVDEVADALSHQGSQPRRLSFSFAIAAPLAETISSSPFPFDDGGAFISVPDDVQIAVSNSLRCRQSQTARTLVLPV